MDTYRYSGETSDAESCEKLLPGDNTDTSSSSRKTRWRSWKTWVVVTNAAIQLALLGGILYLLQKDSSRYNSQVNFSLSDEAVLGSSSNWASAPAREAIRYETRNFNAGYLPGEKSKYQLDCPTCAPTDRIDAAWKDLYSEWMWSKIPRAQAAQLRNLTINIPGNEDHYLIGLDVFHQLHCLDNVRKGLWPDRYSPEDHMGGQGMSLLSPKHLDHCIDQIRQSIMCQSDLSTNWLFWDDRFGSNMGARDVEHSCRSFDSVVDWARDHWQKPFDLHIRLQDPLKQHLK